MRVFRETKISVAGFWYEAQPGMLIYAWDEQEAKELVASGANLVTKGYVESKFSPLLEVHS